MTQVIDEDGVITPVTVLKADENVVVQVKTVETDGYNAIQVGYMDKKEKNVKKPVREHFKKANAATKRYLKEVNFGEETPELNLGDVITVDQFEAGDIVDIVATSKGKGTQGAIKRWNYGRGPASHGSKSHRVAVQELQVLTQQEFSKVEKVQERWVTKELLSKTLKLLK